LPVVRSIHEVLTWVTDLFLIVTPDVKNVF
jgi:hypothetical protein